MSNRPGPKLRDDVRARLPVQGPDRHRRLGHAHRRRPVLLAYLGRQEPGAVGQDGQHRRGRGPDGRLAPSQPVSWTSIARAAEVQLQALAGLDVGRRRQRAAIIRSPASRRSRLPPACRPPRGPCRRWGGPGVGLADHLAVDAEAPGGAARSFDEPIATARWKMFVATTSGTSSAGSGAARSTSSIAGARPGSSCPGRSRPRTPARPSVPSRRSRVQPSAPRLPGGKWPTTARQPGASCTCGGFSPPSSRSRARRCPAQRAVGQLALVGLVQLHVRSRGTGQLALRVARA